VPLDRVRLTAAKSGFGRHRKLRLARPQGSAPVSASDDELRLARPRARTRPRLRKTTNFASPDPRARTRPWLRKTTNSASPDPRARTRPRLRKTTNSASLDPRARTQPRLRKTTNSASPDLRARTQPWPQTMVSASPDPGLRLDLDLGRQTRPRPRRSHLKEKCALGSFLSILVIECQHKCLNVNLCSWMNKVQIKSKGMSLSLSTLVLCTNILV
jgi:hypothetical protein